MTTYRGDITDITGRMRAIREAAGLSLQRAHEKFGIPAVVLGSWERGDRNPSISSAQFWAQHFGCRLVLLEPGQTVIGDIPDGNSWVEYVVLYGDKGRIDCDSFEEAAAIVDHMPEARVAQRVHTLSELQEVET